MLFGHCTLIKKKRVTAGTDLVGVGRGWGGGGDADPMDRMSADGASTRRFFPWPKTAVTK